MNNPADSLSEQLSAYMDGELPEAEARFLLRRLEHDAELRSKWERLHLAAACMKGHPLRVMSPAVSAGVDAESAAPAIATRRPLMRWATAASVAALALFFAPQLMRTDSSEPPGIVASTQATAPDRVIASPASADLVALTTPAREAAAPRSGPASAPPLSAGSDFIERNAEASAKSSPMPLSMPSPADFPLVDGGDKRTWPRSELIGAESDPTIEAYLVRHNQMLANDGMGGFVPYVDVVASDSAATASDAEAASPEAGTSQP